MQHQLFAEMRVRDFFILFQLKCEDCSILVTEPYFNFASIQEAMNEMLFEEYQFKTIYRCNGKYLILY